MCLTIPIYTTVMAEKPNVIVFFTDQQRHDSTGLHGNPLGLTPNFDRLARAGTHVANSFTCQPVCGPARACLQTGTYATTNGVILNNMTPWEANLPTLAECFNDAGYETGYIGKWHLSDAGHGPVPAEQRGGYKHWLAANALEFTSGPFHTVVYDEAGSAVTLPGNRVDALTDAAIRYVDRHQNDPFFLFLSHLEPHHQNDVDDYPAPPGYREMYTGKWVPPDLAGLPTFPNAMSNPQTTVGGSAHAHLGGYWGMVKRLDEALGRLMDALQSLDLTRKTIVLFTSDHACHFKTRNKEYKRSCHDSSIRVPTMLTGPGFEAGGELPQLVSLLDLPPTLLDAAGLDVPDTMQGRSIRPLIRREEADWPAEVFVQISEDITGRAIRTPRWTYCVENPESPHRVAHPESYTEAYLYDNLHDPHQLCNLVDVESHSPVREACRQRLLRRMKEAGEPEPRIDEPGRLRASKQRVVSEAEAWQ